MLRSGPQSALSTLYVKDGKAFEAGLCPVPGIVQTPELVQKQKNQTRTMSTTTRRLEIGYWPSLLAEPAITIQVTNKPQKPLERKICKIR